MKRATQKQIESGLKVWAADLGRKVTIRRNSQGEYESRISVWGKRNGTLIFVSASFDDAHLACQKELERIEDAQRADADQRKRQHERAVGEIVSTFASTFSALGLTLFMRDHVVTMSSPKTGTHSLHMGFGNRPVGDLIPHLCGFIEAQTHNKPILAGFADVLNRTHRA